MAVSDDLCRSFLDLWWHFDPAAATRAGAIEHDGRLGSFDAETVREHVVALRAIAGAVEELDVAQVADEIDRTALLDHLRVQHFRFEYEHPWKRNPALWVEHAANALEGLLPLSATDLAAAAALQARLGDLPRFLRSMLAEVRQPPVLLLATATMLLDELAVLVQACGIQGDDWIPPVEAALLAVAGARQHLLTECAPDPSPHGAAIGEDEVDRRLHHEHASVHNAAELWRGALREATEVEAQVVALAAVLDPTRPWRDVYERRRDALPAPGEWTEVAGFAIRAAGEFAARHQLGEAGSIPVCRPAPPYSRVLEPGAAYRAAGPRHPAALLVGTLDPLAIPWIAVQLGSPGLHLQQAWADRSPRLVRRHIASSSTSLGWGLYAVEWMLAQGYAEAPELRLAAGVHRLRAVHLAVADLGLHTRQFTAEAATDHLVGRLPIDRASALALVRRIACRPIEACAALLGRRELLKLRDDVAQARGPDFKGADFHTEVLAYGGLPVPLIRWGMGLDG